MPVFKDSRKTVTVNLDTHEGSEIVIYTTLKTKDFIDVQEQLSVEEAGNSNKNQIMFWLSVLQKAIKSWNFTDEDGNDRPITVDNLMLFWDSELDQMLDKIEDLKKKAKEKSS